jgi:hypothetical protein
MRKLKIIEHISLDGVIQAPGRAQADKHHRDAQRNSERQS